MAVRQISCLYLVVVRADCVCECRFIDMPTNSHSDPSWWRMVLQ